MSEWAPPAPPPHIDKTEVLIWGAWNFCSGWEGARWACLSALSLCLSFVHKSPPQKFLAYLEVTFYKQNVSLSKRDRSFNFCLLCTILRPFGTKEFQTTIFFFLI
jgi:hypothetical protein